MRPGKLPFLNIGRLKNYYYKLLILLGFLTIFLKQVKLIRPRLGRGLDWF